MVQQSLLCPVYNRRRRSKEEKPRQEEGSGEVCRGEIGIGREYCKNVFKLLALVPPAAICGQQTHASPEQVPQHLGHHLSLVSGQASLSAPSNVPVFSFCVWSRRQRLQHMSEVAGACPVPASLQLAGMSQREAPHPQLPLFPKLSCMWHLD